jgi:hypothetical protein
MRSNKKRLLVVLSRSDQPMYGINKAARSSPSFSGEPGTASPLTLVEEATTGFEPVMGVLQTLAAASQTLARFSRIPSKGHGYVHCLFDQDPCPSFWARQ